MIVDILLSTYNSENYLSDLLKSLSLQTYKNWRLLVRDDGSSDNTLSLLNSYKKPDPERILIIDDNGEHCGPKKSFEKLLEKSTADYIMFCDHDDYWMDHKIEGSLNRIKEIEKQHPEKAILVFTDLSVADQDLKLIHKSFWNYAKIKPSNAFNIYKLAVNNPVVGCTVILNKIAKSLVLPIPNEAIMHDWWSALKVSESGIIDYIEEPSIFYRQHNANKIGAEKVNLKYFLKRFFNFSDTIKQNVKAYKMLKSLGGNYSIFKMMGYKLIMLFLKSILK